MTQIEIIEDRLKIEILGWHKLWALKSRLEFPVEHVVSIQLPPPDFRWTGGLRMGGTYLPGVIKAGRYYQNGKWVFWDVGNKKKVVVIELMDEGYSILVLEVEEPEQIIRLITDNISPQSLSS